MELAQIVHNLWYYATYIMKQFTCTIDKRESSPSNEEARTGTPITGKGVNAATIPKMQVGVD